MFHFLIARLLILIARLLTITVRLSITVTYIQFLFLMAVLISYLFRWNWVVLLLYVCFLVVSSPITLGSIFSVWRITEPVSKYISPDNLRSNLSTISEIIKRIIQKMSDPNPIPRRNNREEEDNPIPDRSELIEILASVFEIGGYLAAKAAKDIGASQEKIVQNMADKMKLKGSQRQLAEHLYRQGKGVTEEKIQTLTSNLKNNYHETPEILNIFMMILMEFIYDTKMIDTMNNTIETIARQLNLQSTTFNSLKELTHVKSKNIKELKLENVYKIVGISDSSVSNTVIKKTARSMKKIYHPDTLRRKGLPKEMEVFGTQLSQIFNSIYQHHIKKL